MPINYFVSGKALNIMPYGGEAQLSQQKKP